MQDPSVKSTLSPEAGHGGKEKAVRFEMSTTGYMCRVLPGVRKIKIPPEKGSPMGVEKTGLLAWFWRQARSCPTERETDLHRTTGHWHTR